MCDELEEQVEAGGVVVDYHGADLFPERWFDLVLVLRSDNTILYQRLESRYAWTARLKWHFLIGALPMAGRGYSQKKITENVEAEIMQVVLDEAREAYREDIVVELASNCIEDLESNVQRALQWLHCWKAP